MPALQSLRFLCVMFVLLHHAYPCTSDAAGHAAMVLCEGSVAFFFVLSGYVLSMLYGKRLQDGTTNWFSFMGRRLRKLYPLHVLCLALYVLTFIRHLPMLDPLTLLASILLIQSWIPVHDIYYGGNAVAWFLSSLLFCYALFPILYRLLFCDRKRTRIIAMLVGVLLYGILLAFNGDAEAYVYVAPYARVADFAVGIAMARWMTAQSVCTLRTTCKYKALSFLLIVCTMLVYPHVPESVRVCSIYWPACLVLLRCYGVPSPTDERPGKHRRVLRWLGDLSFPFYMVHIIAMNGLMNAYEHLFSGTMPLALTLVATTIASLIFAYAYQCFIVNIHKS